MPENRDYITSSDENGSISISEDVVSAIAALAVAEMQDTVSLAKVAVNAGDMPDRKNLSRALRITSADGKVSVDLSVRVRYGEKIPAVAAALQSAIEQAIDSQAGLEVDSVNVHVVELDFTARGTE